MSDKKNVKKEELAGTQQAKSEKEVVIWLGPSISGVAMTGTVYKNGLPPQMQKAVDDVPALANLLVPITRAVKVRRDLSNPRSASKICYDRALKYIKERGEKS